MEISEFDRIYDHAVLLFSFLFDCLISLARNMQILILRNWIYLINAIVSLFWFYNKQSCRKHIGTNIFIFKCHTDVISLWVRFLQKRKVNSVGSLQNYVYDVKAKRPQDGTLGIGRTASNDSQYSLFRE